MFIGLQKLAKVAAEIVAPLPSSEKTEEQFQTTKEPVSPPNLGRKGNAPSLAFPEIARYRSNPNRPLNASTGETVMLKICRMGTAKEIDAALQILGIEIDAADNEGYTALHNAAKNPHANVSHIQSLIKKGADIRSVTKDGITVLCCAASHHCANPDKLEFILDLMQDQKIDIDAPIDERRNTAFHIAAFNGISVSSINTLKTKGANINAQNTDGDTPLHCALIAAKGNTQYAAWLFEVVKAFINNGSDLRLTVNDGDNALHLAMGYQAGISIIDFFLTVCKIDPNAANKNGFTPLHYADLHGSIEVVELLLALGADPRIKNCDGKTAFDLAIGKNPNSEISKRLKNPQAFAETDRLIESTDKNQVLLKRRR